MRDLLEAASVEARLVEPLARYGDMLLEANRRFNLTGAKTAEEIVPHILDSLSIMPYVRDPLVDVGSGGGFPAIPVAIATGVHVTCVETIGKKARFLREALDALSLQGEVVVQRAEVAGHDAAYRERFASATARAVSSASAVAEFLLPLLAIGGVAILQRGTMDENERIALDDACLVLGGTVEAEHQLGGERRILLVRKTSATSHRFPRRPGIPEKRPLCTK